MPPKTPALTAEDKVALLIACIKYSEGGKINWARVAEECGITTPGAAAKRYERILKAAGVTPSAVRANNGGAKSAGAVDENDEDGSAPTPKKGKAAPKKGNKKRKVEEDDDGNDVEDAGGAAGAEVDTITVKGEGDDETA
ncbi:hypothetical protein H2203_002510 [Taxawa tesnikishii (nom. ined.)]|nr:hypothetical protein H2203_002510 [Dothideales sp. JES 119]